MKKALGGKAMGSTFDKVAKRVNKHLAKDIYSVTYPIVIDRVKVQLSKMIEKAAKDFKVNSVTKDQLEYFMSEDGAKIV